MLSVFLQTDGVCSDHTLEKATVIALGAITLHNFLRSNSNIGKIYIPPELADQFHPVTGELTPGI